MHSRKRGWWGLRNYVNPKCFRRAKRMRHNPTPAERVAWEFLRGGRKQGRPSWRRQVVLRGFIADFYCPRAGLVLEIDGGYHHNPEQRARDARRSEVLRGVGIEVLRLDNAQVTPESLAEVLAVARSLSLGGRLSLL